MTEFNNIDNGFKEILSVQIILKKANIVIGMTLIERPKITGKPFKKKWSDFTRINNNCNCKNCCESIMKYVIKHKKIINELPKRKIVCIKCPMQKDGITQEAHKELNDLLEKTSLLEENDLILKDEIPNVITTSERNGIFIDYNDDVNDILDKIKRSNLELIDNYKKQLETTQKNTTQTTVAKIEPKPEPEPTQEPEQKKSDEEVINEPPKEGKSEMKSEPTNNENSSDINILITEALNNESISLELLKIVIGDETTFSLNEKNESQKVTEAASTLNNLLAKKLTIEKVELTNDILQKIVFQLIKKINKTEN